jgi:hypothetical protein
MGATPPYAASMSNVREESGPWIPADDPDAAWFAVRQLFLHSGSMYEEQVTLWRAPTFEEAERRARLGAEEHARDVEAELLPLAQIYRLAEFPADEAEVFSLIRSSELKPADYLSTFFSTGAEHQGSLDSE